MRICLLGDFTGTPDEGMKNISRTVKNILSSRHVVLALNLRSIIHKDVIMQIRAFKPDIVHYLHGPTIRSLAMLKGLKTILNFHTKTIVSATRPYFSKYSRWAVPYVKPDLILTQSQKFEAFFQKKGFQTLFFPNGINCRRFAPVDNDEKTLLRKKLGIPLEKKIVLHVGHIKKNRSLDVFIDIQQNPGVQVLIIGSTTENVHPKLNKRLQQAGIITNVTYIQEIADYYKSADIYVFPVKGCLEGLPKQYNQIGAIDLPLSVLEAMACNLPVATTPFGALPRIFKEGEGLRFIKSDRDLLNAVKWVNHDIQCATRNKVLPYDWPHIIASLEQAYKRLLYA